MHLGVRVAPNHPSVLTLGAERMGSGTLVAEDLVLTVNYVTLGAAAVTVTGPHGRRAKGEVVARDFDSGLALVKVPRGLGPPARLGEAAAAVPGQPVFLLASASPTARRVRPGVLTEVGPFDATWEYMLDRALKASAPNPGFGGGALCDLQARMLGVVSLSLAEVARASLAIPVDLYRGHRDELLRHGRVLAGLPGHGSVSSARAGRAACRWWLSSRDPPPPGPASWRGISSSAWTSSGWAAAGNSTPNSGSTARASRFSSASCGGEPRRPSRWWLATGPSSTASRATPALPANLQPLHVNSQPDQ